MNLQAAIAGLALILALGALSLTAAAPIAHAGLVVGTPVPVSGPVPTIHVSQASHLHCTYHPEGYKTCTFTHTLEVTGTGFILGGGVMIYLNNAQAGAIVAHPQTTASHLSIGHGATFARDTNQPYCTSSGWLVQAFDLVSARYSNSVAVGVCTMP
jgi:hypothetical protein